jgi:hypothetical protein
MAAWTEGLGGCKNVKMLSSAASQAFGFKKLIGAESFHGYDRLCSFAKAFFNKMLFKDYLIKIWTANMSECTATRGFSNGQIFSHLLLIKKTCTETLKTG